MGQIFLYVCIIMFGAILARKELLPSFLWKRTSQLQSLALYILLGAMGLKIGSDNELMSNLPMLGLKSFVLSVFTIVFSIFFVMFMYRGDRK